MIIWIASYPKSGNTWVRAIISTYLNFNNNNPFENILKIKRFPNFSQFKEIINLEDLKKDRLQICKYWLSAQKRINSDNKITFLKTHNLNGNVNGNMFTNSENTIGFIYLVRDPRSVVVSIANHNGISIDKAINNLLNINMIGTNPTMVNNDLINLVEFRSSWKAHYLSWTKSSYSKLIIRYEDLHSNTFNVAKEILNFIKSYKNIEINDHKLKDTINICNFENLSKLEKSVGFTEKVKGSFFRKGKIDDWKNELSKDQIKKIESAFSEEMKELNYL
tara:strand:+ start:3550 stop:4380 length:831 start_codon:yes stop_codon:yes gene_type:complete